MLKIERTLKMTVLWAGLLVFLGVHALPIRQTLKEKIEASLGDNVYKILFSLISVIGLVLIIYGYGIARDNPSEYDPIYTPPTFLRHIALLLMLIAFISFVATYIPSKIKQKLKNPMLISIKVWALAHLLANGNLADVILFGCFLVWAVIAVISAKKRQKQKSVDVPQITPIYNDILVILLGTGIYILFALWLHERLIGVAPIS